MAASSEIARVRELVGSSADLMAESWVVVKVFSLVVSEGYEMVG